METIFDTHKAARSTDPVTSHKAAASMPGPATSQHNAVLATLETAGFPMAAEQIADRCGLSHIAVNRRLPELERAELVCRTDELHTNRSGRKAVKWDLVA